MSDMVTRCPACSTSFRITPGQIQKARGAVRCGSCLHIFNAEQHLVSGANPKVVKSRKPVEKPRPQAAPAKKPEQASLAIPEAPKPAAKPKPPAPDKPASKPQPASAPRPPTGLQFDQAQIDREVADDDDLLISDDMGKTVDPDDDALLYTGPSKGGVSLFDRHLQKDEPEFTDGSDESWAENLLEEDLQGDTVAPLPDSARSPLSVTAEVPDNKPSEREKPKASGKVKPEEKARDLPPSTTADDKASAKTASPLRFEIRGSRDDEDDDPHYEPIKAYDRERSALLMNIDPEPVEFTVSEQGHWRRKLLWGGLSLLALLLLVVQVAWLQFDRLSRQAPYRDYYQSACNLLGCELPQRVNTARIRTYNLVVRDHPEQANALLVDAIILNTASFEQPFPPLLLSFTDMDNQPVASRAFAPAEYLRGELAGTQMIPPNQPVHLSLEIADPGAHAVNYRLQIP